MNREDKQIYTEYIKEFDPTLNNEYIENLVNFLYKRSNLYSDKIGLWIAYLDCHEEIHHGRIDYVKGDTLSLKRKNGCYVYINHKQVLGKCDKPNKRNKNPEIYPFEDFS